MKQEGAAVPAGDAPPTRSLTDRTLIAMVWQFGNKGFEAFGRIFVMILLARLLSPYAFGIANAGLIVALLADTVTQLGVAPAIVQRPELTEDHINSGFLCSLAMGVAGCAIVWVSSGVIADFFHMPELRGVVRAIGFCFPISAPVMVAEALLMRKLAFRTLAMIDTASFALGYAAVGIVLALLGIGYWSLVIAQLSQVAMRSVLILIAMRHPVKLRFQSAALRDLLSYGSGHTLAELGNFAALQSDNIIVGHTMGAIPLGLYSRAYTLLSQPSRLVGMVFDRVLFPAMSNVKGDKSRLVQPQRLAIAGIALIMAPGSMFLVLMTPEVVAVLLGPKWLGVVAPFRILAATLLFRTSYKISDSVARACGATFQRAWRQWTYAALVIAGAWFGSRFGLAGVATGVGFAIMVNYVLMLQLSLRLTGGTWRRVVEIYARIGAGMVPMTVVSIVVAHWARGAGIGKLAAVASVGAAGALVFLATLLLLPGLFGEEAGWMRAKVMRRAGRSQQVASPATS